MTQEHYNLMAALSAANGRDREPTPGCPSGRSRWHSAERLQDEEGLAAEGTDLHRTAGYLQRKGLVAARSTLGVTRWALTEDGLRAARALVRSGA